MSRTMWISVFVLGLCLNPVAAQEKVDTKAPVAKAPAVKVTPAAKAAPPASLPAAPVTVDDAVKVAGEVAKAAAAKNWWYLSALVVLLLMFGLKVSKVLEKLGRWKYAVSAVLALAAGLLSAAQGGLTWSEALGVFTATWATGQLQQLVEHGILGKPHTGASGGSVG